MAIVPVIGSTPEVSVIVWAVPNADAAKLIVDADVVISARSTAPRRSISPAGAPTPSVATPTTSGTVTAWSAPMSIGESSANPR